MLLAFTKIPLSGEQRDTKGKDIHSGKNRRGFGTRDDP
jgi:hypothetical protein